MPDIDLKAPEVQDAIQTAVAAAVAEATTGFEAKLTETTAGLKTKNQELLGEVKKFKKTAQAIPEGFDAVKWQEMIDAQAAADEDAAKAAGKWDEYKAELVATHETEKAALLGERDQLKGQLEGVLVNNSIMAAIAHEKGNSDLLMPHVRDHVKLFDEDGELVARVIDKAGNPRITGAKGDFMSIEGLLEEFKETDTFAPCFEGSRSSGAGAGGDGSGGTKNNPFASDSLNLTEQARLNREDPNKAARLKAAASGS